MGELRRHPIARWRTKYGLLALVETGTWRGDGVLAGLTAGYPRIITVDVDPKAFERTGRRVQAKHGPKAMARVEPVLGDSAEVMPEVLRQLGSVPTLFWLDAHYPAQYSDSTGRDHPLLAEVRAIVQAPRDHSRDVLVADDLRIYGIRGHSGPLPRRSDGRAGTRKVELETAPQEELHEVMELLEPTHTVAFDRRDGCYLVARPR